MSIRRSDTGAGARPQVSGGEIDHRLWHMGCDVEHGVKLTVQKFKEVPATSQTFGYDHVAAGDANSGGQSPWPRGCVGFLPTSY
jgi:hypothetical protein